MQAPVPGILTKPAPYALHNFMRSFSDGLAASGGRRRRWRAGVDKRLRTGSGGEHGGGRYGGSATDREAVSHGNASYHFFRETSEL